MNDEVLIDELKKLGHGITEMLSSDVTLDFCKEKIGCKFLISLFLNLSEDVKSFIIENCDYHIISHDYKFLREENPALFPNFKVTDSADLINVDFFEKSKTVFCQSSLHKQITLLNLPNLNCINLSGNLWNTETLDFISLCRKRKKIESCAVVKYMFYQKGMGNTIDFLNENLLDFTVIQNDSPIAFLNRLTSFESLAFFPRTPETLSRVVLEARMADMQVYTSDIVGATHEDWYGEKDILKIMREKQKEIPWLISQQLNQ